jgi:hypothetical protein
LVGCQQAFQLARIFERDGNCRPAALVHGEPCQGRAIGPGTGDLFGIGHSRVGPADSQGCECCRGRQREARRIDL